MGVRKKKIITFFMIHIGVLIFFLLYYWLFDGCIIRKFTGISCPTCGVSRAWLSFLSGHFNEAFNYHPYFIPLTIVFLLLVHSPLLLKKFPIIKKPLILLCVVVFSMTMMRYLTFMNFM